MLPRSRILRLVLALALGLLLLPAACKGAPEADTSLSSSDSDRDGVPDHVEAALKSDPQGRDSDGDGLTDYHEVVVGPARDRRKAKPDSSPGDPSVAGTSAAAGMPDWEAIKTTPPDSDVNGVADVADGWTHNLTYTLEGDIASQIHASVKKAGGWWGEDGTRPTPKQYNDAFIAALEDETSTPAPLIDDAPPAAPDLPDSFTEQQAIIAWSKVTWEARLWNGFLDDDGDGLPNAWETYGYSVDYDSTTGHRTLAPWGCTVLGKAQYRRSAAGNGPFDDLLPQPTQENKRPAIIGARTVVVSRPDYSKQYFKTCAGRMLSDGDPDTDYDEAFGKEGTQGSKPPYSSPVVGAFPEFEIQVTQVTVSAKETITDTNGNSIQEKGPSTAQSVAKHLPGFLRAPLESVPSLAAAGDPSAGPRSAAGAGAVGDGEDEAGQASTSRMSDFMSSAPAVLGQVSAFFTPQPNGDTTSLSRATCQDTGDAAKATLALRVTNHGGAPAEKVTPSFSLFLGGKPVGGQVKVDGTFDFAAGQSQTMNVVVPSLTLDEFKAFQTGSSFSIWPAMTGGDVQSVSYDSKTHKEVVVDQGSWDVFQNNTRQLDGTIVIDGGEGYFAKYAVQAQRPDGPRVTVGDTLRWAAGSYSQGSGQGYRVPAFDGSDDSTAVPDWKDWMFVFYRGGPSGDASGPDYVDADFAGVSSPLDVEFRPGSIVYVIRRDRLNTTPSIRYATMGIVSAKAINSRIVSVGLSNTEECPAGTEIFFVPDAKTDPSGWFDASRRLSDHGNGTYDLVLEKYVYTGRESVVARVSGVDAAGKALVLTSPPSSVALYDRTDIYNAAIMAESDDIKAAGARRPTGTTSLVVGSMDTYDSGGSLSCSMNRSGVIVQTHNSNPSANNYKMFYRVGVMDFSSGKIAWGDSHNYDIGVFPRVALLDDGTVVEVHKGHTDASLYHNVGKVDGAGKTIAWGDSQKYDVGTMANVAALSDGALVEVHRGHTDSTLYYHVGTVGRGAKTISWGPSHRYDNGDWPAVAVSPNGTVVETHKAYTSTNLMYNVGSLDRAGRTVSWGDSHKYDSTASQGDDGGSVAIAATADGVVLEAHVGSSKGDIWYSLGRVDAGAKTVAWGSSSRFSQMGWSEPGIAFSQVPTR